MGAGRERAARSFGWRGGSASRCALPMTAFFEVSSAVAISEKLLPSFHKALSASMRSGGQTGSAGLIQVFVFVEFVGIIEITPRKGDAPVRYRDEGLARTPRAKPLRYA